MDGIRKQQVSLRGASVKEITRDALLEKVSQERELRNYTRRATAAAIFVQRVWRRYHATKLVSEELLQEWQAMLNSSVLPVTREWISTSLLRPFLFFITHLSARHRRFRDMDVDCMLKCFRILLESVDSTDPHRNFCTLATRTIKERMIWKYQAKHLISLSFCILAECDCSCQTNQDFAVLTSLAMRFVVILIDLKRWKAISSDNVHDADMAVKDLVWFIGHEKSEMYFSIRRYITRLEVPFSMRKNSSGASDDKFLIVASVITLALRPFHASHSDMIDNGPLDVQDAAEQYWVYLLTVPWLTQRLPTVLLSAIKHNSALSPCFKTLLASKEKILKAISAENYFESSSYSKWLPPVGWALANIICLAAGSDTNSKDFGRSTPDLDYSSYIRVVIILSENLLTYFEKGESLKEENQGIQAIDDSYISSGSRLLESQKPSLPLNMSYMDLFRPVYQQWHLMKLLNLEKFSSAHAVSGSPGNSMELCGKCELLDVVHYYSNILKLFSVLNPPVGSLPVLNMLSFTPGFLLSSWVALEKSFFPEKDSVVNGNSLFRSNVFGKSKDKNFEKKHKGVNKDGGMKWVNILKKITGKSQANIDQIDSINDSISDHIEDLSDVWDVQSLSRGSECLSFESSCLIHLFCACYSHLLLVLDDIEFYDKQVPFTLEQQRKVSSMLNTLVYNSLSRNTGKHNKSLMDAAIRCLHLLYERDCRRQFCPPDLWLSPARKNRLPIAVAARYHEVFSSTLKLDDSSVSIHSVINTTPHIYPFEERVQMFREFISMDKVSQRMAGEMIGPGPQAVEVVIRRGHIVEDGFQQLNSLGSKLKSSIHVSFVSECGVPEAGLDYGGLSKEFLTDIAKDAFSPKYGLFSQTQTSDRLLIPNPAARYQENGVQMIEFLGKIVGKALYEGILLEYSFSHVFVQKLLGRYSFIDELSTLDPELYKNLIYVKHYNGDVKDLSLDFTVTEESQGKWQAVELKSGGKDISVTNENKLQYVYAMADYKLNRQILPLSNAFYRGLTDLISPSWLKLFNASEFNQLLSGGNHDIDVEDLRNNTRYSGGYTEGSRTVKLFWEVISGFEPKERCLLLKFVTSCSRAPLLGFKHLQPTFTIHKVASDASLLASFGGQDVDRLPSASTCYNTLKLPTYKRSNTLRAKLLYAINSNSGFELS